MVKKSRHLAAVLGCLACTALGGAQTTTTYSGEAAFLAALSGTSTVQEGFEGSAWSAVRSTIAGGTNAAPSVTSQGIAWSSNHAANEITTGSGAANSGGWGVFSSPHGDQSVAPTDFIRDGFIGSSATAMTAVGGWFTGTANSRLVVVLDGGAQISLGNVGAGFSFHGVVMTGGSFTSFEFREIEGTLEDQRLIFADDFTVATAGAASPRQMDGVVSGVANIRGANGSDWHTDLYLHNASAGDVTVDLYFSPAGGTVGPAVSRTVAADHTDALPDVVSGLFGTQGSGAVYWRTVAGDGAKLFVNANTYNRVDAVRRYGQQVPGVRWSDVATPGTPVQVPALAGPYRTNLGIATDGSCSQVVVRGYDRQGALKVERTLDTTANGWMQINQIFRKAFPGLVADPDGVMAEDSLHRFEVEGIGGRVMVYASVVDNLTNDGSYLAALPGGGAAAPVWFPGAAFLSGANQSRWRSDLIAFNMSGAADTASVTFYRSGRDNSGELPSQDTALAAEGGALLGNVLRGTFGLYPPAVGSLSASAASGLFWMRTYTEETDPARGLVTYGQAIPVQTRADAVPDGGEGRVFGFTADDRTRANLILQNTCAGGDGQRTAITVDVEVLDRQGAAVVGRSYALRPGEYLQHNAFLGDYGVGVLTSGALRITPRAAGGACASGGVIAMVSEVNGAAIAGTNDGRLMRAAISR